MPTAEPTHPAARSGSPARGRLGKAVLAAATALGLLFGLTAPSVSPVSPAMPGVVPVTVVTQLQAGDPATPFGQQDRDGRGR